MKKEKYFLQKTEEWIKVHSTLINTLANIGLLLVAIIGVVQVFNINVNLEKIHTSSTNNTLGRFETIEFNSTCVGFRSYPNGGLILSCKD